MEQIVARCCNAAGPDLQTVDLDADAIHKQVEEMTETGMRVLAFARAEPGADCSSIVHTGDTETEGFFDKRMYVHRWFALSGDSRATGRAITGFANLMFLFLLISGIYLWVPKVCNRVILKSRMFFNPKVRNGKARDFNGHHVFAFWSFIPLFFIITTAAVCYYPWANKLVYGVYGEEVQSRRSGFDNFEVPAMAVSLSITTGIAVAGQRRVDCSRS